ncbi:hypothetical protein [uncultured Friedmanniella sp.]|uniref:hypothetical protein n=1 Tax=uncultured Friedmanniella sp. TaxID=335381 RepID=UPI0035CB6AF7
MARAKGSRPAGGALGAALLALFLAGGLPTVAAAKDKVAFTMRDDRITESSGLVRDTAAQLYWTVNDSGSSGVVYGVTASGAVRGTLRYRAPVQDVEAVALHDNRLYAADIGDNDEKRDQVTVYYFLNPRANGLTVTYNAYDFRYPDGAHDAETLLVDGAGRLYLVTKGATGGIYVAPKEPSRDEVNVLRKVADAPALVTDGVFLPGDDQIALLTASSVEVLDAGTYRTVATAPLPAVRQPESLAVNLAGNGLLVGTEGTNSKVYAVAIPTAASATPSATPTASSAPGDTDDSGDTDAATPTAQARRGTYLAVGLAALVAIVAGVVVGVVRKP